MKYFLKYSDWIFFGAYLSVCIYLWPIDGFGLSSIRHWIEKNTSFIISAQVSTSINLGLIAACISISKLSVFSLWFRQDYSEVCGDIRKGDIDIAKDLEKIAFKFFLTIIFCLVLIFGPFQEFNQLKNQFIEYLYLASVVYWAVGAPIEFIKYIPFLVAYFSSTRSR